MNDNRSEPGFQATRHHGVADAIERLAADLHLEQDGPHVAFIVTVNGDTAPDIYVAGDDGKIHHFSRISHQSEDKPKGTFRPAPWSFADLLDAGDHLHAVSQLVAGRYRSRGMTVLEAITEAARRRQSKIDRSFDDALAKAAHEAERPHVCEHCSARYKTAYWLTRHINTRHTPTKDLIERNWPCTWRCDGATHTEADGTTTPCPKARS